MKYRLYKYELPQNSINTYLKQKNVNNLVWIFHMITEKQTELVSSRSNYIQMKKYNTILLGAFLMLFFPS